MKITLSVFEGVTIKQQQRLIMQTKTTLDAESFAIHFLYSNVYMIQKLYIK